MNILPGIVARYVAPVLPTAEGMMNVRYWKMDNFVYHSSGTQIYGFGFYSGSTPDTLLTPSTVTTNLGTNTNLADTRWNDTGPNNIINMDSITEVVFDFGTQVKPQLFEMYAHESDLDYITSFDISASDDGVTYTKVGEFNINETVNRILYDATYYVAPVIWANNAIEIPRTNITVVDGRVSEGVFLNRPKMTVIHGRAAEGVLLNRPKITVIEKPV